MVAEAVLQIKVTLRDIRPPIWRRIQVPASYNFWDLHVAIQDAMGWSDYHLHEFRLPAKGKASIFIGIPDEDFPSGRQTLPGWKVPVTRYLSVAGDMMRYEYDFGDGWEHDVILEGILSADPDAAYPRCIAGRRACPPEDCGGPFGYAEFLEAIADPNHERHEELVGWVGGQFDPGAFRPEAVEFDDPEERWQIAFGQ